MRLTCSQKKAIHTLDRTVSVSAGAGSGKTEVLVQRFCGIVEEGLATVDQILAVTFTEKAAKEMKQRIVLELDSLAKGDGGKRFEEERRRVESAYIGTIHSFATRVLRENAFEAGIDPRFRVMDEAEAGTLKDTVLDDLIEQWHAEGVAPCLDLLQTYKPEEVKTAVLGLHRLKAAGSDQQLQFTGASYTSPRSLVQEYCRLVEELIRLAETVDLKGLHDYIPGIAAKFPSVKVAMEAVCTNADNAARDLRRYVEVFDWDLYEEARSSESFVRGGVGPKDIQNQFVKPAKAFAKEFLAAVIQPLADHYRDCMRTMADEFGRRYENAKRAAGGLDFDDLLLKTRGLLITGNGQSAAAEEYRKRFKFVIMDEFQDTNLLQKSIVEEVCPAGHFFCVGDPKQSIYRFNGADVSVFVENHRKVESISGEEAISFVENFRSRPEILSFVNTLFERLWANETDLDFEKLKPMGEFRCNPDAGVELMLIADEANSAQGRLAESRAIAARINQLLGRTGGQRFQVTRKKNPEDQPRDLHAGDIMILFRSTTDIPLYEKALSDAGIPFYVVSGRGFYETHEVSDIHCLLKVVDNTLDDVSMAAVLRSPMVGVTDDTLWWLTRMPESDEPIDPETISSSAHRDIGKLYRGLMNLDGISQISEADRVKLTRFADLLDDLRTMSAGAGIAELVDTAIRKTAYDLKVLASPDGKRKYANVRKVLDLAESCQATGQFHLTEFIHHIENMKTVAQREGEAPTETEDSKVVRLMTVHQAKGLQSPVVFVADSSRRPNNGSKDAFLFSRERGFSCRVWNPATGTLAEPSDYSPHKETVKQKDQAEAKRLFYVAATRAEELLVVCGQGKYDEKHAKKPLEDGAVWSTWLERAFGIVDRPQSGRERMSEGDAEFYVLDGTGLVDTYADVEREPVSSAAHLDAVKQAAFGISGASDVVARCKAVIGAGRSTELVLTVSRILDYLACPKMYHCKWVLGIHEESPDPKDVIPDDETDVSSTTLGTAVHQLLRAVDFSKELEPQFQELMTHQPKELQFGIKDAWRRFLESEWSERIANGSRHLQEIPLRLKLDSCDFRGRADLLFQDDKGWTVVDYKTGGSVNTERYSRQVGIYALAVKRCLGVPPSDSAVISLSGAKDYVQPITDATINDTESMIGKVAEGIRSEEFGPCKSSECDHCSYKAQCDT